MEKDRLQAFSDGVIAILITIMVLELHVPKGSGASDLHPLVPVFVTYLLSFVNLGIYWNNHHRARTSSRRCRPRRTAGCPSSPPSHTSC